MNKRELIKTKKQIPKIIKTSKKIAIITSKPDEDAIGSGLALEEILEQLKKDVKLFSSYEINEFSYLPRSDRYIVQDITILDYEKFDIVIVLDAGNTDRIIDRTKHFDKFKFPKDVFVINIDHHPFNEMFGKLNYVLEEQISSTAEEIFDIFSKNIIITPTIATNLLAGIIGDTASFKNTPLSTPKALRISAKLLEHGADHRSIIKNIFYSFNEKLLRANIKTLKEYKVLKSGKYTFVYIIAYPKDFDLKEPTRSRLRITLEILKGINGTNFSVRFVPLKPNLTKISFRAHNKEILKLAEYLGGGGHTEAAGAVVRASVAECLKRLKEFLESVELPDVS